MADSGGEPGDGGEAGDALEAGRGGCDASSPGYTEALPPSLRISSTK